MKIEQDSKQYLETELPRLQVVQTKQENLANSEIICVYCGSKDYSKSGTNRQGNKKRYRCKSCNRRFVEKYEPKSCESDDVISAATLGLRVHEYQSPGEKLNFSRIKQVWLKKLAIKHIRYKAGNRELGTLRACLTTFRSFSDFLAENDWVQEINNISRSIVIEYIDYLNCTKISPKTKNDRLSKLADFFETGVVNSSSPFNPQRRLSNGGKTTTSLYSRRSNAPAKSTS
jgi:integrase/recombinase XerD